MDLVYNPLETVNQLLKEDPTVVNQLTKVGEYFRCKLSGNESKIPCINQFRLEDIPEGTLVRFRGMVQDMLDPEFYLGVYHVTNPTSNEKEKRFNCYSDNIAELGNMDFENCENVTLERQTVYCVPIPGENQWVKEKFAKKSDFVIDAAMMSRKRGCQKDDGDTNGNSMMDIDHIAEKKTRQENGEEKRGSNPEEQDHFDPNYPLPNGSGQTCFVTLYSELSEFKMNEVAEFICVIDSNQSVIKKQCSSANIIEPVTMDTEESLTLRVPRLHCLYFNKLSCLNPEIIHKSVLYEKAVKELSTIRNELMSILTELCEGDTTAAEYLLLHLISATYAVVGVLCVGKLSLNISNIKSEGFSSKLYRFLEKVLEKSFYLPLTIENLNKLKFSPKKDYEANCLISGILQLSSNTNLVLDEMKMEPGKLDVQGLNNLKSLGNLMQWQNVEYDFQFSKVEMKTSVNVMVLSEGRSMLQCDCQIPVTESNKVQNKEENETMENISETFWEKARIYLSAVRMIEYNVAEEVSKALEEDFVEMRKTDPNAATAESFSLLLTTARFMALSYGQETLDAALWTRTKNLDAERKSRLK